MNKDIANKTAKSHENVFLKKFVQTQMFVTLLEDAFTKNIMNSIEETQDTISLTQSVLI